MYDYEDGMKLLSEYAELSNKKTELESKLLAIKKRMAEIETLNVDFMLEKNLKNLTINGRVLFLKENRFAQRVGTKEEVVSVLKKVDNFADLVTDNFNSSSLNARVKEYYDLNGTLPPEFDNVISLGTEYKIGSRKAA